MRQSWARGIGIPVAALQILSSLGAAGLVIADMATQPAQDGPESMTIVTVNISSVIFKLLTAVFPAIVLFILAKRSTREALGVSRE